MVSVRSLYRKVIPLSIRKMVYPMVYSMISKRYRVRRERRRCYGKLNRDKTFYVIRQDLSEWGLYTTVRAFLWHIKYAVEKGYIPVIDLKNYYMAMLQGEESKYKENAWEYYYEQPIEGIILDEVYQSKQVILASMDEIPNIESMKWNIGLTREENLYWSKWAGKYLRLKREIEEDIQKEYKKLFPKGKKVLGVSVRRNYEQLKQLNKELVEGHPEQAGLDEYIKDIDMFLQEWNCDSFLLSTEDRETCSIFKEKYGEKCILLERNRRHSFENNKPLNYQTLEDWKKILCEFELNEEGYMLRLKEETISYIKEVYLLARCDSLLASLSGGVYVARLINGGAYEHEKIYKKGIIHVEKEKIK